MSKKYLTAESVCAGHPDKLCDYIADSILDACLEKDNKSRVACEVLATKGHIVVAGEITCKGVIDVNSIVGGALVNRGYNPNDFLIDVYVHNQSKDIAGGVDIALEIRNNEDLSLNELGAGDQGTVYGYATRETKELLPLPLVLSHEICKRIDEARRNGVIQGIGPDGKSQVTIEYEFERPTKVKTIIVSIQHDANKNLNELRCEIINKVLIPASKDFNFDTETEILINPSGRFVEGGPAADTGLTGRKIMVDTYGGLASHGGGAFSGKDPTKVDRSGAYFARYIAKNIVASGLARKCEVALSYAIGKAAPVAISVNTFKTSKYSDGLLTDVIKDLFNARPQAIIDKLDLSKPIYKYTSAYGHFNSQDFTWEKTDKVDVLREEIKAYDY
jgi:S-adenosylmethionine synthetase